MLINCDDLIYSDQAGFRDCYGNNESAMSNVNILRLVGNIKDRTVNAYTPIVESVVNAIQSIEKHGVVDGKVSIRVFRTAQRDMLDAKPKITSIEIEDNGAGFTDENKKHFDTLYSDHKMALGGKGFGRFTGLKFFTDVRVDSVFIQDAKSQRRQFKMGKEESIIVDEIISDLADDVHHKTVIRLDNLKKDFPTDDLLIIAKTLVIKLLPYFITKDYVCPEIVISEDDGGSPIRLNDYLGHASDIVEVTPDTATFELLRMQDQPEIFKVRAFKIYGSGNSKSRISLVAHKREVTSEVIHKYIPEFLDEFYDNQTAKNFIIRVYVFGDYLDENVSLERGSFDFDDDTDDAFSIGRKHIEREAANIAKACVMTEVSSRQDKKRERVQTYVESESPWHKELMQSIDISSLPMTPSQEEIEEHFNRAKFAREQQIKNEVKQVLNDGTLDSLDETITSLIEKISDSGKNDLVHYVSTRKAILDLFEKSLVYKDEGSYFDEKVVHDIIFPRKKDSDSLVFDKHNLWMLDERLNFTSYAMSDIPMNKADRPDLLVYDQRVAFRGENEASNPITIFEFKKPGRDDFINPSSKEDPIEHIKRYMLSIKKGNIKLPNGRELEISENTPFYGYVLCTVNKKVQEWLSDVKDFRPLPDGQGWFNCMGNNNLYIEVISWDKLLKDARLRNKVFFERLGI